MKSKEKDNNLLSEKRRKLYAKYLKVIGLDIKFPEIKTKEWLQLTKGTLQNRVIELDWLNKLKELNFLVRTGLDGWAQLRKSYFISPEEKISYPYFS